MLPVVGFKEKVVPPRCEPQDVNLPPDVEAQELSLLSRRARERGELDGLDGLQVARSGDVQRELVRGGEPKGGTPQGKGSVVPSLTHVH